MTYICCLLAVCLICWGVGVWLNRSIRKSYEECFRVKTLCKKVNHSWCTNPYGDAVCRDCPHYASIKEGM